MDDRYMTPMYLKEKLKALLRKYKKLFIAYDFDDTVRAWREEDRCLAVPHLLRVWKDHGIFILYTSSPETRHREIKTYLRDHKIPLTYINENPDVQIGGKVFYNVFLDDKCGLGETYRVLRELAEEEGFWYD